MSNIITLTPAAQEEYAKAFWNYLTGARFSDGRVSFSHALTAGNRKAVIHYTRDAWEKQARLIRDFDVEVAWHGVVERDPDEDKDEYTITDILVYPQTVAAASVEMDTEKYALWLQENYADERFNHIHMQGHSHVNMGTSPSGVDLNHQEEILRMLGPEGFYIFMIWNKSGSRTNKIFDMKKNVMFEDRDITVTVEGQPEMDAFIKAAKELVVRRYSTPATWNGVSQIYAGGAWKAPQAKGEDSKPAAAPAANAAPKENGGRASEEKEGDSVKKKRVLPETQETEKKEPKREISAKSYLYEDDDDWWEARYGRDNYRSPYYYSE